MECEIYKWEHLLKEFFSPKKLHLNTKEILTQYIDKNCCKCIMLNIGSKYPTKHNSWFSYIN